VEYAAAPPVHVTPVDSQRARQPHSSGAPRPPPLRMHVPATASSASSAASQASSASPTPVYRAPVAQSLADAAKSLLASRNRTSAGGTVANGLVGTGPQPLHALVDPGRPQTVSYARAYSLDGGKPNQSPRFNAVGSLRLAVGNVGQDAASAAGTIAWGVPATMPVGYPSGYQQPQFAVTPAGVVPLTSPAAPLGVAGGAGMTFGDSGAGLQAATGLTAAAPPPLLRGWTARAAAAAGHSASTEMPGNRETDPGISRPPPAMTVTSSLSRAVMGSWDGSKDVTLKVPECKVA
jgi:hypothetical protein